MTVCYPQFILPKFLVLYVPLLFVHSAALVLAKRKGFFKSRKQLVLLNTVIFILYTIAAYFFSFGINEFGVINCIGD